MTVAANADEPDNSIIHFCADKYEYNGLHHTKTKNWMDIATCITTLKNEVRREKQLAQWEFVKNNPRYRFPGQSLNNCFGREKELALHRIETKDGKTTAYYKDSLKPCKGGNSG